MGAAGPLWGRRLAAQTYNLGNGHLPAARDWAVTSLNVAATLPLFPAPPTVPDALIPLAF